MKLKLLTASVMAVALVGCGGGAGDAVFDVPASSSSSSSVEANVPAVFSDLSATVSNSTTEVLKGRVTVTDDNDGESAIQALTDESTMYGSFTIDADGFWQYTLDTDNSEVSSLAGADDTIVDDITLKSTDGTEATLAITINGGEVVSTTKAAKITDQGNYDAGELRYKLSDDAVLKQGKLTVSFLKEANAVDAEGTAKDAYIGLYGSSTSTSNAIVDLRIQADQFVIRDHDDIDVTIPFTPGKWTPVTMTWDASNASDTQTPLVTITINGQSVTTDAFSSASNSPLTVVDGVQTLVFKFGDDSAIVPDAAYYVDNIKLYSDKEGTDDALVFQDDFEDRPVGEKLDPEENPDIKDYHKNSQWAEVANVPLAGFPDSGADEVGPGTSGNKFAKITDSTSDDAGELRYKLGDDSVLKKGRLSVYFKKDDNAVDESGSSKDAYISLYGSSTSTSDAIVDLRIKSDKFAIRDQDSIDVDAPFTPGKWTKVEMAWDASNASATVPPKVTIWIDGTEVAGGAFDSASSALSDVMNGVQTFVFKFGDNSAIIPSAAFAVDNIAIYSDMDGTADAKVFSDDFEARTAGDSLDPDVNANITDYHSNTADAVVAEEE